MTDRSVYGLVTDSVNCDIIFIDEDIEDIMPLLRFVPEVGKPVKSVDAVYASLEDQPMRLVQFKDCDWTMLYLCRGTRQLHRTGFFNHVNIEEFSLTFESKLLWLAISDTAGVYGLHEYFIGQLIRSMGSNRRHFAGEIREVCESSTISELDDRLRDLKVRYSMNDDGGLSDGETIVPYIEAEPMHRDVRKNYLLL
ncbi:MAG: hypothetical protein AAF823_02665 [Planctomycetota bacterium]